MYKKSLCFALLSAIPLFGAPSVLRIENLSNASVQNYQTGIDSLGDCTIAYTFTRNTSPSRSRNLFLRAVTLLPNGVQANISDDFEIDPSLAGANIDNQTYQLEVSSSGNALLVWTAHPLVDEDTSGKSVIFAAYMNFTPKVGGDIFSPWVVTQLSSSFFNVTDFDAAIDESGNAVVAWRVANGLTPSRNVVQAAYKLATGNWEIPSDPNTTAGTLSSPFFNVSATPSVGIALGNATVAWQIFNGGTFGLVNGTNVVQASYRAKSGVFQLFQTDTFANDFPTRQESILSTIGFRVATPPLVTANASTSVVTWQVVGNPNTTIPDNVIQAFVRKF